MKSQMVAEILGYAHEVISPDETLLITGGYESRDHGREFVTHVTSRFPLFFFNFFRW